MGRSILFVKKKYVKSILYILTSITLSALFLLALYNFLYIDKIYPNIFVAGRNLGRLNTSESQIVLAKSFDTFPEINLIISNTSTTIKPKDVDLSYDFIASASRAYNYARSGNIFFDYFQRVNLLIRPKELGLIVNIDEVKLSKIISVYSSQVSEDPTYPTITLLDNKINIDPGKSGSKIDENALRAEIGAAFSLGKSRDIQVPIKLVDPRLTNSETLKAYDRANKYIAKKITMRFESNEFILSDNDLINILDPKGDFNNKQVENQIFIIASKINRPPQNPKFEFNGGKVSEFLPAKNGIELESEVFKTKLIQTLNVLENGQEKNLLFEIPVVVTPPETSTDKVNDLGIRELIGRGTSTFKGSIATRIHNVRLASSNLNGILIKPGEIFSFNDALGDVSKFTGYQEAYVIRDGKTVLGDGGGVCQVSSTLFRAALNAGLPITERRAHAYRVGYYEQGSPPGLDATVYGPTPDLKIKNNTPGYILIQTKTDVKNYSLLFELYGTSDGRVAVVTKPKISDIVAPGEDLYVDDPTLPIGVVKQTEHKASGAKVTFNYSVTRGGETLIQKTFISNYRPWQAVFLRGTASKQ